MHRTLHDRLGIRILSSRAERISHSFASLTRARYFQPSKIKHVSPRGHVISSISYIPESIVKSIILEIVDISTELLLILFPTLI